MAPNYFQGSVSEIVARRLQRKQTGGTLANWPPQNAMRQTAPTRGTYSTKQSPKKLYNMPKTTGRTYPTLGSPSMKKPEVRLPSVTRFNFLKGI